MSAEYYADNALTYNLIIELTKYIILVIGIITSLGTMGVHVGALIGGLGLVGFALGFAMKDIVSNLLAGIIILLYRPIRAGHHIEILGVNGHIANIDLRYTTLENDEQNVLIPNTKIFSSIIRLSKKNNPNFSIKFAKKI